ncbi:hypothetical protein [Chryseobacterium mucoviscidosis]|uniref:hypothetical protein n=1 Tax=Chryseobacterium mucoviscidosis TaxID=1945581 RepID=UPI00301B3C89
MSAIVFLIVCCNKNTSKKSTELKDVLHEKSTDAYIEYKDDKFDFNNKTLKENLHKAIYNGDTLAYNKASKEYGIHGRYKEFLYYAILMAEKNNYRNAYWDISTILSFEDSDPLFKTFESKYGKYSMLKAYEMGQSGAKSSMGSTYIEKGKLVPKASSVYCSKDETRSRGFVIREQQ